MTRTIPAGQIGNAKPIRSGHRTLGLDRPADPDVDDAQRSDDGNDEHQVTSVTRGEPDASLFQVPSDYKVVTGKQGDMLFMPAERKPLD